MTARVYKWYKNTICHLFPAVTKCKSKSDMASRYDKAIIVFSRDSHLLHFRYSQEAVGKGSTAVTVHGLDIIVLIVEKKSVAILQAHS
jgi:hypothetical protein